MTTLSGPMLAPISGKAPTQAVVLLHGYGSDGADLIGLAPQWQTLLPDALFVSPNAPEPCPGNPLGFQWFALDLDRAVSRVVGLNAARPILVDFLQALWSQTGITPENTLLVGFSQGAMMALHVGLSLDQKLMGIVAFSGAFTPPPSFTEGIAAKSPVCLIHGDRDEVVDPALSAAAAEVLRASQVPVSYHVSRGVGHGIAPDGLAFASAFITSLSSAGTDQI